MRAWLAAAWGSEGSGAASAGSEHISWFDPGASGESLSRGSLGSPVSLPLLIAALVFAVIELALARWFSHAKRESSAIAGTGGDRVNKLFSQLLDLQRLDLADESVRFAFERPLPAWAWAGVVMASCALAAWSYSRLTGGRVTRALLAGMRALLLVLLVVLIAGPQLVQKSVSVERDWVLVLIDRSLSLTIPDVSRAGSDGTNQLRRTRESQLRDAIRSSWPMWSELSRDRTVVWLGFDAGAFELDVQRGVGGSDGDTSARIESVDLGDPTGRRTSIGSALDQALARGGCPAAFGRGHRE